MANQVLTGREIDQFIEHRDAGHIETEAIMPKCLRDEEKISAPAANIQDLLPRETMEIEILRPSDVLPNVRFCVEILRIMSPQSGRVSWH